MPFFVALHFPVLSLRGGTTKSRTFGTRVPFLRAVAALRSQ